MTQLSTVEHPAPPHTFGPLPVGRALGRALGEMGYTTPTPIQERAIPHLRAGRDVLGQAQTGTGKTAGFGIPLIEAVDTRRRAVQAIVLVPTRELCLQVAEELAKLGRHAGVDVLAVYGGVGMGRQLETLVRGVHVVVGTPGRVEDHLQRGSLDLSGVRLAVLDEADRMLDVGFLPAIEAILRRTPATRQTALFSATMPAEVRGLAERQTRDPITVAVDPERATVDEIVQHFQPVADGDKLAALCAHLDDPRCTLALVFRRTTHKADRLARDLTRQGYRVAVLHGRRTQGQRERVLADLKAGTLQALVATDIAARGLDIVGLTHVFNYDLPDTPETYVHRIGRTGRAGESGTAITLVAPDDAEGQRAIERYLARRKSGNSDTRPAAPPSGRSRRRSNVQREAAHHPSQHAPGAPAPHQPESAGQGTPTRDTTRRRRRRRWPPRREQATAR